MIWEKIRPIKILDIDGNVLVEDGKKTKDFKPVPGSTNNTEFRVKKNKTGGPATVELIDNKTRERAKRGGSLTKTITLYKGLAYYENLSKKVLRVG